MSVRGSGGNRPRLQAAAAAALFGLAALMPGCGGTSYSCGTASADHCYGIVTWKGKPTGMSFELTAVQLTAGDRFIDDEGWLIEKIAQGDPVNNARWVETGETNEGLETDYFFADNNAANSFMFFDLGPVMPSDVGNWIAYSIAQDDANSSLWFVTVSRAADGTLLFKGQSQDNPMTPNTIEEGMELAGSQGGQPPIALFGQNSMTVGSQTKFQTTDGTVEADHPPNAAWLGTAKPSQTSNGGLFVTDCC